MALSQADWYAKLKSWVPTWFFESEHFNVAEFQGIARLLSEAQQQSEDHVSQTFLSQATDTFLDTHANERNYRRLPQEIDAVFSPRIRSLLNQSNFPAIKILVDAFLIVGESTIREHFRDIIFLNREAFYSRREVFTDIYYNAFSIIVEKQLHVPYSFASRENFFSREDFAGSNESSQTIFDLIVETVNNVKAAGTLYRVIERD
jgi:uncharacterized radical SAM superfamily Fe-S cluster-containing enzyme